MSQVSPHTDIKTELLQHWFPQEWWKEAHRILKPKGTVALFTAARGYFRKSFLRASRHQTRLTTRYASTDPNTPHREEMQKLMDDVKRIHFDPYAAPGNWILYNMYDELPLASSGFSEARRIKWNVDGKFEAGQDTYSLQKSRTIDELVRAVSLTMSVACLTQTAIHRSRFITRSALSTHSIRITLSWLTRQTTHSR